MLLSLTVKIGEIRHGQHRRAAARRSAEQCDLKPVVIPLRSKRPRDLGGFGPLQILMCSAQANRATSGDSSQPQTHIKLQRTSLILRTDNLLAGKLILPFEGRLHAIVLSSATLPSNCNTLRLPDSLFVLFDT